MINLPQQYGMVSLIPRPSLPPILDFFQYGNRVRRSGDFVLYSDVR